MTKGQRFLAVDGGGSRSRIALVVDGHRQVVESGPTNVSSDFDAAIANLTSGCAALGVAHADLPAYLGLAGVINPEIAEKVSAALPLSLAKVEEDRLAALHGALRQSEGLLAHCGTGSFVGCQIGRERRFVGGWGPILGDEASAQWVGRRALSETLRASENSGAASTLTDVLLKRFGGPAGIVRHAADVPAARFGDIAPTVTRLAEEGDAVARQILQSGATYLSETMQHLGWAPGRKICLTGGIGPFYASYLPPDMQANLAPPQGTPLDGAISLAEDAFGLST